MKHLRKNLKQFSGHIDYQNYEVEYEMIDGVKVTTEIRMRFSRLFENGIVLRNLSYIYVTMDGRGELKRIRIKWPTFEKMDNISADLKTEELVFSDVDKYCKKNKHVEVWSNNKTKEKINSKKVEIKGVGRGWLQKKDGNDIIITPAISFSVSTETEGGDRLDRTVDVPMKTNYSIDDPMFSNVFSSFNKVPKNMGKTAPVIRTTRK